MINKLDPDYLEVWKDAYPGLEFEEKTHTYTVDGEILPSVSTLLKNFYDEFNTEFVAKAYAKKHGFRVKDVKDAWAGKSRISTDRGTLVHLFAEDYAKWKWYGIGKRPKVTCKQTLGALQFLESLPEYIYPIGLEVQMYSKYYGFTGTGDLLLENGKTDEVYWADFKSNESLTSDYKQKPLKIISPKHGLVQDSFGKYCVQLSLYGILLAEVGVDTTQRIIIHLRDNPETKKLYTTHRCPDLRDELRPWLEQNKYNFT